MTEQMTNFYRYSADQRRQMLRDAYFYRGPDKVYRAADGRAAGESTLLALCDAAFCRFVGCEVEPEMLEEDE